MNRSIPVLIVSVCILVAGSTGPLPTVDQLSSRALGAPGTRSCTVCGSPVKPRNLYCTRCRRFIFRKPDHRARASALKEAWDPLRRCFRCWYTGIRLRETDPSSRRYLTFDHVIPGDDSRLVACCRLINEMKSDMTWDEFFTVIAAFDIHRRTGAFPRETVNLERWSRAAGPARKALGPAPPTKGKAVAPCVICQKPSFPGSDYCSRHRRFLFGKYERRSRLAVCARFVNGFKAALTARQFARLLRALARMMDGEPFDERAIPN